ncbi:MAG: selenocysteine-specific translation elongation factor [Deltaproteobacteria bacterium GWC2_65_14]|nr:MAG: selenocysteine-specific translation elongation factor [Deltaproteobacteria bacterium GWC2_65_14]
MSGKVIVGTAGHIDHGKSALVRALTGTDPDRLKEEKERGITIELGFARLSLPSGILAGIVDVPGHERFVRTMVAGAAGIDIVMLVIAADEGVMPQTREHLDICRLLAIRGGLVALTKRDKVDPDWAALQEEEVRSFVRGTFLEDAPIVPVSSVTGEGLPRLVSELDRIASAVPGKDPSLFFRLPVDRSFTMKGFGTVVTGTVVGGTVRSGDEVQVLPGGESAKVRGLQVHGGPAAHSTAGTRTAVNLQGLEKESVPRGAVLCHPGTFAPTKAVDAFLEYLPLVPKPLRSRARVSFHAGTFSCLGRVFLYGTAGIPPGGSGYARIELEEEHILGGGDRFILRGFAPLENFGYTIGGGAVLSPCPPPRRKGTANEIPEALPRLRSSVPEERILAAAEEAGRVGLGKTEAAVIAGTGPEAAEAGIERLLSAGGLRGNAGGRRFWHTKAVEQAAAEGIRALSLLHDRFPDREGFPREEVAAAFPVPPDMELLALAFSGRKELGKAGELHFLPERRPRSVDLSSPLAKAIADKVRGAGLSALSKTELADSLRPPDRKEFEKTLEGLVKAGKVLRVKDLHFDPDAVSRLRDQLVAFLEKRKEITVPEFKELGGGLSRKYIIPLMEHFDLAKVTLRIGDKRILRKGT